MPETRNEGDDLVVVHSEAPVTVLLTGLPPVYSYGLQAGLADAGLPAHTLRDDEQLASRLAAPLDAGPVDPGPIVVVVPGERAPELALRQRSRVRVVLVLPDPTAAAYATALHAGATGVVSASADIGTAVQVIRGAVSGQTVLPQQVARALCRSVTGATPEVSARERSWLRTLADSTTVAGLAQQAGYSEREMYRLLAALYARLGAANRTEALLLAERCGLLDGGGE